MLLCKIKLILIICGSVCSVMLKSSYSRHFIHFLNEKQEWLLFLERTIDRYVGVSSLLEPYHKKCITIGISMLGRSVIQLIFTYAANYGLHYKNSMLLTPLSVLAIIFTFLTCCNRIAFFLLTIAYHVDRLLHMFST